MLSQFLVGAAVSMGNIVVHAMLMTVVVQVAQTAGRKATRRPSLRLTMVMTAVIFDVLRKTMTHRMPTKTRHVDSRLSAHIP